MKQWLMIITVLTCILPLCAQRKMSPLVRERAHDKQGDICVFIQTTTNDTQPIRLSGAKILDSKGDIHIAIVPKKSLTSLANNPNIRRIEASKRCELTLDRSRSIVNSTQIYEGLALPQAYDGKGVVLGIMDIGFDLTHPTFLDEKGVPSRVKRFWDQVSCDTTGSTLPVGREYTTPDEIYSKKWSTDACIETHGTHTLGIATGSGAGSPYKGMAPGADICMVSNAVTSDTLFIDEADYDKYTTATDALGFKYIFDYAESVGKPCVITFSEGFSQYFDEENALFDQYVQSLLGPGRILVTSAGNQSVAPGYIHKPRGTKQAGAFLVPSLSKVGFIARADANFTINIGLYDGGKSLLLSDISLSTANIDTTTVYSDTLRWEQLCYTIDIEKYPSAYNEKDTAYYFVVGCSDLFSKGPRIAVWASGEEAEVEMRSQGMWSLYNEEPWTDAATESNILEPGSLPRVITVGATDHRPTITNAYGNEQQTHWTDSPGTLAKFSSIGPTFQDNIKPDICAPGNNIVSAWGWQYLLNEENRNDSIWAIQPIDHDGHTYWWAALTGTSMSTPIVAGVIALWLQACPTLSPEDIQQLLSQTSRRPEQDLSYPNNRYGHGEIDAYAGLLKLLGISGMKEIDHHIAREICFSPTGNGMVEAKKTGNIGSSVTLIFYTTDGRMIGRYNISERQTAATIGPLPKGILAVQVKSSHQAQNGSQLIRIR